MGLGVIKKDKGVKQMERADAKKLMRDIADVYSKSLDEIADYWKESEEKRIIQNGRERVIAAEPPEKRAEAVRNLKSKAYGKVAALIGDWTEKENVYFQLNGSDVTDDIKLLSDVFSPSIEQLQALANKYFGKNRTMEQAIVNFANGKDRYKAVLSIPRTQAKEDRADIIDFFDAKIMKPTYSDTADRGGIAAKPYDYQNARELLLNKWVEKIV